MAEFFLLSFCFFILFFWGGKGGEGGLRSIYLFLIKLLVITFHLKIVNEGTSVAFDDIICTHSLKHKTIQPNKYNVTLSRSFKVAAESFAN